MATLAVTGANGLLGQKLGFAAAGRHRVTGLDLHEAPTAPETLSDYVRCDVTDQVQVDRALGSRRFDGVIHTAAFTDVDGCESRREDARALNVGGAENVARACARSGSRLVHLSTDYVFDGASGPYDEDDIPNPISTYGATKLESERAVFRLAPGAVIARTMVLYGHARSVRPNFVTWLVARLRAGQSVRIVTDQFGHPTLADDLAGVLLVLFERGASGLYHTAGSEWIDRHAFALAAAAVFGLDSGLITPTTSDAFVQPAPRPLRSGLTTDKLFRDYGIRLSSAAEGLAKMRLQMKEFESQ
jgi:dTDP-4-dehydrorhamnose reductase